MTLERQKNPAAVALGRLGGLKGGRARAEKLSAERRSEIARSGARARTENARPDHRVVASMLAVAAMTGKTYCLFRTGRMLEFAEVDSDTARHVRAARADDWMGNFDATWTVMQVLTEID
ncbi:MAG: hypothetical protein ACM31O_17425 [Bacteroidota bacterium]